MSEAAASGLSSLDPSRLPPVAELQATRLQVEKELEFLSTSHGQLVDAKAKCLDNITMINHLRSIPEGQEMLASITNSMFIPVQLKRNDLVMTDIGTGFLAERDCEDAQRYYHRKVDTVVDSIKKVEASLMNKQNAMKFLDEAVRVKADSEQQQQKQQ